MDAIRLFQAEIKHLYGKQGFYGEYICIYID